MQVYSPFGNIALNAAVLSEVDLSQQIRCGLTALSVLRGHRRESDWHPTILAWTGFETALAQQVYKMLGEWRDQGFRDNTHGFERLEDMGFHTSIQRANPEFPWWWGDKRFHAAQRAALVRHDSDWYGRVFQGKANPAVLEIFPLSSTGEWSQLKLLEGSVTWDDNRLMFLEAKRMSDLEFINHANEFHQLMGPKTKFGIRDKSVFDLARALHDRFHSLKIYDTHDHIR
jgi:hypothetical protein